MFSHLLIDFLLLLFLLTDLNRLSKSPSPVPSHGKCCNLLIKSNLNAVNNLSQGVLWRSLTSSRRTHHHHHHHRHIIHLNFIFGLSNVFIKRKLMFLPMNGSMPSEQENESRQSTANKIISHVIDQFSSIVLRPFRSFSALFFLCSRCDRNEINREKGKQIKKSRPKKEAKRHFSCTRSLFDRNTKFAQQ